MPDTPTGGFRVNLALILGVIGIMAAAYNGSTNFFKAGQAYQAIDSRLAQTEAKIDASEEDRANRRAENQSNLSRIDARITAAENEIRTLGSLIDRSTASIAALESRQEQFSNQMQIVADAVNKLTAALGIQTEILRRVEESLRKDPPTPGGR